MKKEHFYQNFTRHFPEAALAYCCELWLLNNFSFTVRNDRKTKLGDFRYHRIKKEYSVTVNRGLNPYAFLVTYIHEVAHVYTYRQHGSKVKPHGPEWQENFRRLAAPVLSREIFPEQILRAFSQYLHKPAASTSGCMPLTLALRAYDQQASETQQLLAALETGSKFVFKERTFIKVGKKRTRALCRDLRNGRNYLISEVAQVEAVA